MRHDNARTVDRRKDLAEETDMDRDIKCGACGKALTSFETITVAGEGDRCYSCFNRETADRLGVTFDNTPLAPIVLADADGAQHTFEIRSMLVPTGHGWKRLRSPRTANLATGSASLVIAKPMPGGFSSICTSRCVARLQLAMSIEQNSAGSSRTSSASSGALNGTRTQAVPCRCSSSTARRSRGSRSVT